MVLDFLRATRQIPDLIDDSNFMMKQPLAFARAQGLYCVVQSFKPIIHYKLANCNFIATFLL